MNRIKQTGRIRRFWPAAVVLAAIVPACCLFLGGCGESDAAEETARADIIALDGMTAYGPLERPAVRFPHDLHTAALEDEDTDCTTCHIVRDDGVLSMLYKRTDDTDKETDTNIYHDNCIQCHQRKADEGIKTGPVACGECHLQKPVYTSSRRSFGFDKSLHFRHIRANEEKCENCHHTYNEETKTLVYEKGTESSCRDCHRQQTEENRSSFRLAAHSDCVGCHRQTRLDRPSDPAGPVSCGGCHDGQMQMAIEPVEDLPRLQRKQPDFVLLSVAEADIESGKLNTVPFSHVDHEGFMENCRVCHHETLQKCSDCHTLAGDEKGHGITIQQAMHEVASDHSCVGCHQTHKSDAECAGCHGLMEQGRLSEHACNICHAGPSPENLEAERARYTSMDDFRPRPSDVRLSFTESEIPDTVSIGVLSKEYPPVTMPHGKIIEKLRKHIGENKIATYFHGHEDVVCAGCHHNGSIGRKPALCENCHGEPFNTSYLFKPGLNGAYHRQCLGCHLDMGLQKASNCEVCHKKVETAESHTAP